VLAGFVDHFGSLPFSALKLSVSIMITEGVRISVLYSYAVGIAEYCIPVLCPSHFFSSALYNNIVTVSEVCVRFEVFTAVTMKNVIFWDIKTQFVPHRRHITSPLQSPAS
jgi:hypothetical protein